MNRDIEISISKNNDVSMLNIKGDVTAVTGEKLEDAYEKISADGAKKILLLFDKESYINSGGIAFLISVASESKKREQSIRLTGLSDHFQKIFYMVGLTKYMSLFPSGEAALKDF
jgi:anti-anti-sigma factor